MPQSDAKLVPWPRRRPAQDVFDGMDADRLMVFVPAVMSVGLVISSVALIRDSLRWITGRARDRRTAIEARTVASDVAGEVDPSPGDLGVLSRPTYLLAAGALVGGAAYVAVGSIANFLSNGGYVSDISWLLALSVALSVMLGFLGGVSLTVFWSWPHPPAWTYGSLRNAPLTETPGRKNVGPALTLSAAVVASAVATGIISLMVGSGRSVALEIDEPIAQWLAEADSLGRFELIGNLFGATATSASLAALVALAGFRCRVMAVLFPASFVATWVTSELLRNLIARPKPLDPADLGSFPSGHLVQVAFVAGLVPVALTVLGVDRRIVTVTKTALAGAVVLIALSRVHAQNHWPLDALAGIAFGLTSALATRWVLVHRHWHQRCARCPWSDHPEHALRPWARGLIRLPPQFPLSAGRVGAGLALTAAVGLGVLALTAGVPQDPEGYGLASTVVGPVQLGLAGLMAVAGLSALRYRAPAALAMALCATGLGLLASVQYAPRYALALVVALLIPAVLTWLAWQQKATMGSIAVLAAVTATAVAGTASGSSRIYNHYFGPTHPTSRAEPLSSDADWLWLGAVGPRTATVVAGGLDPGSGAAVRFWTVDRGGSPRHEQVKVDEFGLARFELEGLDPTTDYSYAVTSNDAIPGKADGQFTTFADGPQDLSVVLGSCARTGSNGAVFDAMAAEDPDLYIALGDLHYSNLTSSDPADHVNQYGVALRQGGQSALSRSVPTAYVWDDHDYGPNNAGAESPSRLGVGTAYRRAVPHYPVNPDSTAPIAQAFTVGRVRFVLTDVRSQRTATDLLGMQQEAWLIEELTTSARGHALVVWANPTPWISAGGAEDWSNYPAERQRIADALAAADVDNLVMVSGDAHMVAIDDGSNSGYAADGSLGFPVLHAAALDRPGNVKGGPYSEGAFPGAGQYGLLEVDDDGGDTISVRLSGRTWDGRELVSLDLTIDATR